MAKNRKNKSGRKALLVTLGAATGAVAITLGARKYVRSPRAQAVVAQRRQQVTAAIRTPRQTASAVRSRLTGAGAGR